jgi:ABC-type multidrug transport system ATPase subunit
MQLVIQDLCRTDPGGVKTHDDISMTIPRGMFGLLGPNGVGKSTLMRTLATLQTADVGSAWLDDIDVLNKPDRIRRTLGYLPQEFGVYPRSSSVSLLSHRRPSRALARTGVIESRSWKSCWIAST